MGEIDDLIAALDPVTNAFNDLGVKHYVGGSVASSFHGASRSTMDVDLVCELASKDIKPLIARLGSAYYTSETAMRDAVRRRSCFNLIHLETSFKVDVFVSRGREFDSLCMERAAASTLGAAKTVHIRIATIEDSIISKLEWYRAANETSQRQWEDVSRLVKLAGRKLDRDYLAKAADLVDVTDLLERLVSEHT